MSKKNILITGGNGYVGRALTNALFKDYDIATITRKDFDLRDSSSVNAFFASNHKEFDVVIHTAILGGNRLEKNDGDVLYNNILMYDNLVDNKHRFGKFITFGSGAETTQAKSPYGLSKRIIRDSVVRNGGFYNLRLFAVFDENEEDQRFIKSNIIRYLNKNPIQVFENKQMDFFYMGDLVCLVRHYIEQDSPPKEIDCVYDKKFSLSDIATKINDLMPHKVDINISPYTNVDYVGIYTDIIPYKGIDYGLNQTLTQIANKLIDYSI